jgi:hypothetical protein
MDDKQTAPRSPNSSPIHAASADILAEQSVDWSSIFNTIAASEPEQVNTANDQQVSPQHQDTQTNVSPSVTDLIQTTNQGMEAALRSEYLTQVAQHLHLQQPQGVANSIMQANPEYFPVPHNIKHPARPVDMPQLLTPPIVPSTQQPPVVVTPPPAPQQPAVAVVPRQSRKRNQQTSSNHNKPSTIKSKRGRGTQARSTQQHKSKKTNKQKAVAAKASQKIKLKFKKQNGKAGKGGKGGKRQVKGGAGSTVEQAINDVVVSHEAVAEQEEAEQAKVSEKHENQVEDQAKPSLRKRRSVNPNLKLIMPQAEPVKPIELGVCNTCDKVFKSRAALLRHSRRVHGGFKQPCNICGKELTRPDILARHMAKVHAS